MLGNSKEAEWDSGVTEGCGTRVLGIGMAAQPLHSCLTAADRSGASTQASSSESNANSRWLEDAMKSHLQSAYHRAWAKQMLHNLEGSQELLRTLLKTVKKMLN